MSYPRNNPSFYTCSCNYFSKKDLLSSVQRLLRSTSISEMPSQSMVAMLRNLISTSTAMLLLPGNLSLSMILVRVRGLWLKILRSFMENSKISPYAQSVVQQITTMSIFQQAMMYQVAVPIGISKHASVN